MEKEEQIVAANLNYIEALREQTRTSGGTIIEEHGVVMMLGPAAHPILNNVARMDPSTDARTSMEVINDFYAANEHGFTLVLRDSSEEQEMLQAAKQADLVPLISPPEMILERRLEDREMPAGVDTHIAEDEQDLADFRTVASEAWTTYGVPAEVTARLFENAEMVQAPHVKAVVAYLEGDPVACALVHLSHGIAGVYWVSTTTSARGRGLGEACTRIVSNLGFDLGARIVSLQASPMGDSIYRRMGFKEIASYQLLAGLPASS